MKDNEISIVLDILKEEVKQWSKPVVSAMKKDPYKILISTILSLRTKDSTTEIASKNLFEIADNPYDMIKLTNEEIEKAIYPVGFYRKKAITIKQISKEIISKYNGKVPDDLDKLLSLKGVGRKTANLTITLGYNKLGICVDTHVHRITNRWGYVNTKTPDETEMKLREKLPKKYWIEINDLLVSYGQNLCKPISPKCNKCKIEKYCSKINVKVKN